MTSQFIMVTRRNALLTIGAVVPVAGCTSTSEVNEENETGIGNESKPVSGKSSNETDSETETTENPPEINITEINAPESILKGSDFMVTTTINTDTNATITTEAIDENGETIAGQSTQINQTGEQVISLSHTLGRVAAVGNGTIYVRATAGSVTEQASSEITITADWKVAFTNARDNLDQFLSEFAAASSINDPTILDNTISTTGGANTGLLFEAEDLAFEALEGVPDSNDSFQNKIQRVRSEIGVVKEMENLQASVSDIYSQLQGSIDPVSYPQFDDDTLDNLDTQQVRFSNSVSDLNPIVGSRYEQKAEQFASELESIDKIFNAVENTSSAQFDLERERYDNAFDSAKSAKSTFETVIENISDPEAYPPTDRVDQSFVTHVEEWKSAANEIQLSAAAEQQSE